MAALTIPAVVKNYQKTQLKTQFKKVYTTMSAALNASIADNGGVAYVCYVQPSNESTLTECSKLWDDMKKNLKIMKVCTGGVAAGCNSDYLSTDTFVEGGNYEVQNARGGSSCSGGKEAQKNNKTTLILADGSTIISYSPNFGWGSYFIVDINGKKAPNRWGYDIFNFSISQKDNGSIYIDDQVCWAAEKGGSRLRDILKY